MTKTPENRDFRFKICIPRFTQELFDRLSVSFIIHSPFTEDCKFYSTASYRFYRSARRHIGFSFHLFRYFYTPIYPYFPFHFVTHIQAFRLQLMGSSSPRQFVHTVATLTISDHRTKLSRPRISRHHSPEKLNANIGGIDQAAPGSSTAQRNLSKR